MKALSFAALVLAVQASLAATPALAHPEHLADDGHGHSHWLALAIFAGLAGVGIAAWLRRRAIAVRRSATTES